MPHALRRLSPVLCLSLCLTAGDGFKERCARARTGAGLVRILHFGDSHLAGSGNQAFAQLFQTQWGDGGPGFGLPWVYPRPGVLARASAGWRKFHQGREQAATLAAGALETRKAGEWATAVAPFSRFRLHLAKDPSAGKVSVSVDGVLFGELDLAGPAGQLASLQRELPGPLASHRLEVRSTRAGLVRILGVALEGRAGAVYSALAFNGARGSWLQAVPEDLFRSALALETADLVLLAFGTNEALDRNLDLAAYRLALDTSLARFHQAAPRALLVLIGPSDAQIRAGAAQTLAGVIAAQQAASAAAGGLFVDQRQFMGGAGAIQAWFSQGLANRDLIHLTPPGYQRLAEHVVQTLLSQTGQGPLLAPPAQAALARKPLPQRPLPPAKAQGPATIYTYRRREGSGVTITNNPELTAQSNGEWIMEKTQ